MRRLAGQTGKDGPVKVNPTTGRVLSFDPSTTATGIALVERLPELAAVGWGVCRLGTERRRYFRTMRGAVETVVGACAVELPKTWVVETWPGHKSYVVARALSAALQAVLDVADSLDCRVVLVSAHLWQSSIGVHRVFATDADEKARKTATIKWVRRAFELDGPPPEDVADALALAASYYGAGGAAPLYAPLPKPKKSKPRPRA